MKLFSKQTNKWLLSTLLVAALGSQYYYSISSNNMGTADMSSIAADELALKLKQLDATPEVNTAADRAKVEQRRKEIIAEYQPKIEAEKKSTEAKTVQIFCAECGSEGITVTGTEKAIADIAANLSKKKDTAAPAVKVEDKAAVVAKEEVKFETAKERREREKEERDEAKAEVKRKKDEAKEAKADKLRDEKEIRNEQFAEKAEEIADKCQDNLTCKVDSFSSLLNRYTGKKKVDLFAITKAYNQYIDKDLRAGLRGEDGSEGKSSALEALAMLTGSIPSDYKSLKGRAIDSAKAAQIAQASAVNGLYKQADLLTKQGKASEALVTRDQGLRGEAIFRQDADLIYQNIYEGLNNSSKDQTTIDYVRNNYVPDITKLLTQISNTNAAALGQTVSTTTTTGSRVGRGGVAATTLNGTTTIQQSSANSLSNVQFGAPSTNRVINRTGIAK